MGSNVGDRGANLLAAAAALSALPGVHSLARSPLRETPAQVLPGAAPQRSFLNAAARFETCLGPLALLAAMQGVEGGLGRPSEAERERWAPRTVDLDLLFFGRSADSFPPQGPKLVLPHPRWAQRAFVLLPLLDLDPAFRSPDPTRRSANALLRSLLQAGGGASPAGLPSA